ncbi:hypothetical protein FQN57_002159 [Myotisia sp. PD_48]|nr:hypothetical protein FQN57_002159 [Myotisia sp. PD_48]
MATLPLPAGVSSRQIDASPHGLSYHILEAGTTTNDGRDRPLILLLHGFPDIAFSWRKLMPLLASEGYYVVAPDQRGYGRTTGWDARDFNDVDLLDFSVTNLVRDVLLLVHMLGYQRVECIVGHDLGAVPAAFCALARPDIFRSLVTMSHPFKGPPSFMINPSIGRTLDAPVNDIHHDLAALGRKHYKWYYSTQPANSEMSSPPGGLSSFLRGYFHLKSASWSKNDPKPLTSWTASELAKMPFYYVMPLNSSMGQAIAADMANEDESAVQKSHAWLPDSDLSVYVAEYSRTGFQGGLNWYRVGTSSRKFQRDLDIFVGKRIECPCIYISGLQDWGTYQVPNSLEKMASPDLCVDFRGATLIDGAGHWVPQEKPKEVAETILTFLLERDSTPDERSVTT